MSYIGNTNTTQGFIPAIDYFSGNGSTVAFTLSRPVASVAQVQANISNVPQNPSSAFSVSGNTITFTSAPPSGTNNIYVYYTSPITQVIAPGQGTVTSESFGQIVNFTTTGNTVLGDASTDTLNVGNGGLVKDASGNVGIGTASPSKKFVVSNGGAAGLELDPFTRSATTGTSLLSYNRSASAYVRADYDAEQHLFFTSATERMRIDTSGNLLFNSGYGSAATAYGCRAWVNFNGTGTVAIRASGNVTSITDNGVGSYTVNFTTAMPDVNYCVSGAANLSVTGADAYPININAYSTSSCAIDHREAGTQTDTNYMNVAFFR